MKEKLWGARFKEELHPLISEFTKSIEYDWFLFEYEAYASFAWVKELTRVGLIKQAERKKLLQAINEILREYSQGKIKNDFKQEDVHSLFYKILRKKVGRLVDRIHAAKSRNEQIVTIMRLFLKDAVLEEIELITNLQKSILKKAKEYIDVIIPGFTHLQYAQPVLFSHWLLSYLEQLERDKSRFLDCYKRIDFLALGSAALAGSNFKIDRENLGQELGFSKIGRNSIDMVSDRDFIIEYLNANLILLLHLSRLSEDLIIYNSPGYGFILFSDKVTTGSSLMPHKKNPDPLELIRASCSEALSSYIFLTNTLKGLPSSYNRDLQLDKKALLTSYLVSKDVLAVMAVVISELSLDKKRASLLLLDERLYLTDLSEELIRQGLAWKEVHKRLGNLIKFAEEKGKGIKELDKEDIKKILGKKIDLVEYFSALNSVRSKKTSGSTNPDFVTQEIERWHKILL